MRRTRVGSNACDDAGVETYHWRDLHVTAIAWPATACVAWRVSSIVAIEERTRRIEYTANGAVNSMELVADPEQAEVLVEGTVKWDGCADLAFDQHAMTHLCGWSDMQRFQAVLSRLYEMTAWHLGRTAATLDDMPREKYWPSQLEVVENR